MAAKQVRNLAFILAAVLVLSSGFNNCGQRTRVNYKEATLLATGSLRGGTSGGNPARTTLKFGPYVETSTESVDIKEFFICVSQVRFHIAGASGEGAEVVQSLNQYISLDAAGTPLSDFSLPFGDYDGVTLDIGVTCGGKYSMTVINKAGFIESKQDSTMEFLGNFRSETKPHTLTLHMANIAQDVSSATSENEFVRGVSRTSTNTPSDILTTLKGGK